METETKNIYSPVLQLVVFKVPLTVEPIVRPVELTHPKKTLVVLLSVIALLYNKSYYYFLKTA